MLDSLPLNALIAADAGFVGYEFLSSILSSGRHFLVRVGSNVRLLRKLGVVRESGKAPYVRTYADGQWNNNLLSLNQCPLN